MTTEEINDEQVEALVEQKYNETTEFLVGLTIEQQNEVYREAMLAFVYHLSNMSEFPEMQFKVLFSSAVDTGAIRAGLKEKTNE